MLTTNLTEVSSSTFIDSHIENSEDRDRDGTALSYVSSEVNSFSLQMPSNNERDIISDQPNARIVNSTTANVPALTGMALNIVGPMPFQKPRMPSALQV